MAATTVGLAGSVNTTAVSANGKRSTFSSIEKKTVRLSVEQATEIFGNDKLGILLGTHDSTNGREAPQIRATVLIGKNGIRSKLIALLDVSINHAKTPLENCGYEPAKIIQNPDMQHSIIHCWLLPEEKANTLRHIAVSKTTAFSKGNPLLGGPYEEDEE